MRAGWWDQRHRCEGQLALNFPVETLFDYNNCSATIGDYIILHNHITWALRYEEVKALSGQPDHLVTCPTNLNAASVNNLHHWSLLLAALHGPSLFPLRHGICLSVSTTTLLCPPGSIDDNKSGANDYLLSHQP